MEVGEGVIGGLERDREKERERKRVYLESPFYGSLTAYNPVYYAVSTDRAIMLLLHIVYAEHFAANIIHGSYFPIPGLLLKALESAFC